MLQGAIDPSTFFSQVTENSAGHCSVALPDTGQEESSGRAGEEQLEGVARATGLSTDVGCATSSTASDSAGYIPYLIYKFARPFAWHVSPSHVY